MPALFANHEHESKRKVRVPANDLILLASHYANMIKAPAKDTHFLREWREFRKMTQDDLAAALGTSKSVISEKESSKRGLSNKWLERLAPVLQVQKGWILEQDPNNMGADILEIWGSISEEDRPRVLKILETFRKAAVKK